MDNKALFDITYGLYVLTAKDDKKDNGCIINTPVQIASDPIMLSISVNKANYTTSMIESTGKFNISVISEEATFDLFRHFGFQSGKDVDKFTDFDAAARSDSGLMYITEGTTAYISCTVTEIIDCSSHLLFIAKVDDAVKLSDKNPATYSYYQKNIKPKPEAPKSAGKKYVCRICGYIYDEDKEGIKFDDLPADWTCPLCKHPKSDFDPM